MLDERPNPDALLKQITTEDSQKKIGKLKIFFGYAAGVGKTFAMLDAAHTAKKEGVDVVVGYIEPHTRPETLALLEGLEMLKPLNVVHKGITLKEFNLDDAIKRNPELILVDELAHTNAEDCRHRKRYQDIEELLKAGINVYTTVNVQHLESLNDIVASITGVIVRERIPDSVFDRADQVELVDIEPDDLIERLNKGKIYKEKQAKKALDHFFTRENLGALREIAMRRTADRLNKVVEKNKTCTHSGEYFIAEHILICLSSSPSNAKVIRTAARMADAFHGSFTALFVETPNRQELSRENKIRLQENLKLAEQLGARIATVYGDDVPYQIAEYAKVSGISKIIIGRSNNKKSWFNRKASFVERLTSLAPNIDIYIIPDSRAPYLVKQVKRLKVYRLSVVELVKSLSVLGVATCIGLWFAHIGFSEENIITIYILGALMTAMITRGRIYSILSSFASVLVFNFFFIEPKFTLYSYDAGYVVTFAVMFIAGFITSNLAIRVKEQARQSALKAYRTEILLETSQKLQRTRNKEEIYSEVAHQMNKLLSRTIILYRGKGDILDSPTIFANSINSNEADYYTNRDERAVAQWVYKNNKHAGATTNTLPGAKCLYMAIRNQDTVFCVVGIVMEKDKGLEAFEKNLLIAMLGECALALEKDYMTETKNRVAIEAQREQLRSNLLRAISHDLRTPLTSISGNAGILLSKSDVLDEMKKQQLYGDIYEDSMWLINLVENLLSITRIDNGALNLKIHPELIDEVIQEALAHITRRSSEHCITVDVQGDLLMAKMDSRLVIQVIINIVNNAVKYTKVGSHIHIMAKPLGDKILVEIGDDGEGISDKDKEKLFDMFFTVDKNSGDGRRGLGLGLSLCKSIVHAHGGTIYVKDNKPKGTLFGFTLQAEEVNVDE